MEVESTGEPDPAGAKRDLRRWARALPPTTADESAAIVARLAILEVVRAARRACVFLAMPGEVDLAALTDADDATDWVTTRTGTGPLLTVHDLHAPRERHRFGFDQPVADAERIAATTVEVWLVPGLAFDPAGNRLGNGVGYYDRLLATADPAATRIGVTVERRVRPRLPHEPHDQRMHLVVTEERTIRP